MLPLLWKHCNIITGSSANEKRSKVNSTRSPQSNRQDHIWSRDAVLGSVQEAFLPSQTHQQGYSFFAVSWLLRTCLWRLLEAPKDLSHCRQGNLFMFCRRIGRVSSKRAGMNSHFCFHLGKMQEVLHLTPIQSYNSPPFPPKATYNSIWSYHGSHDQILDARQPPCLYIHLQRPRVMWPQFMKVLLETGVSFQVLDQKIYIKKIKKMPHSKRYICLAAKAFILWPPQKW